VVRVTLMWEVRAAAGRIDELVALVDKLADPAALIFRADGTDPRVVVIDPSGAGLPDVPAELVARPPHAWDFEEVPRGSAGL
jgi:hypothetical protein